MDLILWRHAEAEDGVDDQMRRLTPKGHKQAQRMADWLIKFLPEDTRILVSPAVRAQQTAQALGRPFKTVDGINTHATAEDVLHLAGWRTQSDTALVIGHQPTLGLAAALALTGRSEPFSVKKGGLWWLTQRPQGVLVRAVLSPDLL